MNACYKDSIYSHLIQNVYLYAENIFKFNILISTACKQHLKNVCRIVQFKMPDFKSISVSSICENKKEKDNKFNYTMF